MEEIIRNLKICPKCGLPISYIEKQVKKSNTYYIAVHYLGYERTPDGRVRKKVKKCYLGPEDYKYVTKQHSFTLHGWVVEQREKEYLEKILAKLEEISRKQDEILSRLERLERGRG